MAWRRHYLVDDRNPGSYALVLEELALNAGVLAVQRTYTYGTSFDFAEPAGGRQLGGQLLRV